MDVQRGLVAMLQLDTYADGTPHHRLGDTRVSRVVTPVHLHSIMTRWEGGSRGT